MGTIGSWGREANKIIWEEDKIHRSDIEQSGNNKTKIKALW